MPQLYITRALATLLLLGLILAEAGADSAGDNRVIFPDDGSSSSSESAERGRGVTFLSAAPVRRRPPLRSEEGEDEGAGSRHRRRTRRPVKSTSKRRRDSEEVEAEERLLQTTDVSLCKSDDDFCEDPAEYPFHIVDKILARLAQEDRNGNSIFFDTKEQAEMREQMEKDGNPETFFGGGGGGRISPAGDEPNGYGEGARDPVGVTKASPAPAPAPAPQDKPRLPDPLTRAHASVPISKGGNVMLKSTMEVQKNSQEESGSADQRQSSGLARTTSVQDGFKPSVSTPSGPTTFSSGSTTFGGTHDSHRNRFGHISNTTTTTTTTTASTTTTTVNTATTTVATTTAATTTTTAATIAFTGHGASGDHQVEMNTHETPLCHSRLSYIYPRLGVNTNKESKFIINAPEKNIVQAVRVEKCNHEGIECSLSDGQHFGLVYGLRTVCRQKFAIRRLLVIGKTGHEEIDAFEFPSCCVCHHVTETPFKSNGNSPFQSPVSHFRTETPESRLRSRQSLNRNIYSSAGSDAEKKPRKQDEEFA